LAPNEQRKEFIFIIMLQNEENLLKKAKDGSREALMVLIRKYEPQVAATAIGMLGPGPEAEDVEQETFIRFYQSLSRFRGDSTLGTYLTRIAINLSLNQIKRRRQVRARFHADTSDKIDNYPDLDRAAERSEAHNLIQKGLQSLEPKFRSVLVLRLIHGFSTSETARILKLPLGTVLSRLARGQQKLRDILAPLYGKELNEKGNGLE